MSMTTELIKKLRNYQNLTILPSGVYRAIEQAADTIEELSTKLHASQMERSSQYYHGGWVPCEERLPENGYWLWSAAGGEVKKDFYWEGHWKEAEELGYTVIAWRPLPKPYSTNDEEVDHEQMGTPQ